jgi:hypothetical protein
MTEVAVPAPPANAVEAGARLETLKADGGWADKVLSGDVAATKEFNELHVMIDAGDRVESAMAGILPDVPDSGHRLMASTAEMLREIGIRDEVIEQTLRGHEVSAAEYKLVEAWKARQMKDPVFVKSYLSGEAVAREKMTLCNIVLSSEIKKDEAK